MKSNRRIFMLTLVATGAGAFVTRSFAQDRLDEKDPQAAALGYVADSAKADAKKFPRHDNVQLCNGCALWQSKPTDAQGNCALFVGKQVNAKGWCSAWAKKA